LRVEIDEVVVEDGPEFIAEPEVGVALGEGGAGDAGDLLGDRRDGLRLQGQWSDLRAGAGWCKPLQCIRLLP
jgi:hypothetical protein